MPTDIKISRQLEEIVNSTSSGIGLMGAVTYTSILVIKAALFGNTWHIVTFSIFGAGMILLYIASTLFHSAKNLRIKSRLNVLDHSSIYILIAATSTPITLIGLHSPFGWVIFGITWAVAIGGVIFKVWFYTIRWRRLSAFLYVAMGLIMVIAIVPIIQKLPIISLWFLLSGGVSYIIGALFYLKNNKPYTHCLFHIFVIGGVSVISLRSFICYNLTSLKF